MQPWVPVFTISKEFHFSASHVLTGLPEDHPCGRVHGHNYIVRAGLGAGILDSHGFVVDYGELAPFRDRVEAWDHRHLNSLVPFTQPDGEQYSPTAERMAAYLCDVLAGIVTGAGWRNVHTVSVAVSETPKTWATCGMTLYVPEDV